MKKEILEILENCKGSKNAIKVSEIIKKLSMDVKDSQVRAAIRDLVIEDKKLIGSSKKGFFIIQNATELYTTIGNLSSRKIEIEKRINSLLDSWSKRKEEKRRIYNDKKNSDM